MKIAIVVPNNDFIRSETAINLASMILYSSKTFTSITMSAPIGMIEQTRNIGAEIAIDKNCEYLMFIDSNMTFPNTAATRLLQHGKDIVGCNIANKTNGGILKHDINGGLLKDGISNVLAIRFAVVLIKTAILEKMKKPWFYSPQIDDANISNSDFNFCINAGHHNIKTYCDNDLSKEIGHLSTINRKIS